MVTDAQRTQKLSDTEVALLRYLVQHSERSVSREELLREVWGYAEQVISRAVDTSVRRLRRKIEPEPAEPVYLVTVRGEGYRLAGVQRSAPAPAVALPQPVSVFIGRAELLARVEEAVARPGLVTLVGPPGIGKTRTALQVAQSAAVRCWCDLSPVRHVDGVAVALARALGSASEDVPISVALAELSGGLVVLDNLEQLLPAIKPTLDAWVAAAPTVSWLVTSRVRVGVVGERVIRIAAMSATEGAALFLARARDADGLVLPKEDTGAVAQLVARLDGLPLALSLAASRTPLFTVTDLLEQLTDRGGSLSGIGHALAAVMDGVWDTLSVAERSTLEDCALFAGDFSVRQIIDRQGDGALAALTGLRERGLLVPERRGARAFFHLLKSLRDVVLARLARAGSLSERFARHDAWVAAQAASATVSAQLSLEHELRASLDRAVPDAPALAASLARALHTLWVGRRPADDIIALLERVSDLPLPAAVATRFDLDLSEAYRLKGDRVSARRILERRAPPPALQHRVRLLQLKLDAIEFAPAELVAALAALCRDAEADGALLVAADAANGAAYAVGEPIEALPWIERAVSLATQSKDPSLTADTRLRRATILGYIGAPLSSLENDFRAVDQITRTQKMLQKTAALHNERGLLLIGRGQWTEATTSLDEAIALARQLNDVDLYIHARVNRAILATVCRELDRARELLEEAWWRACRIDTPMLKLSVSVNRVMIELEAGDWANAADAMADAVRLNGTVREPMFSVSVRGCQGLLAWTAGDPPTAAAALGEAAAQADRIRLPRHAAYNRAMAAILGGSTARLGADIRWARKVKDVTLLRSLLAAAATRQHDPSAAAAFAALDQFEPGTVTLVNAAAQGQRAPLPDAPSMLARLVYAHTVGSI